MAAVMLYCRCTDQQRQHAFFKLGSIIFFSVLLKTIFNGYEFITTTLIMMTVPLIYYGFLNRESISSVCSKLFKTALCSGLAIAVSVCILSAQIGSASGNFLDGFKHLSYALQKRTHDIDATVTKQFPAANIEGMQASILSVVRSYLQGGFWSIDSRVFKIDPSDPSRRYSVRYVTLIAFFVVMTGVLYLSAQRCTAWRDRRGAALMIACWFSILAPLSWFVIFKAHSYSHLAINFIVWQMPFTFFGAAVTGLAGRNCFFRLFSAKKSILSDD